MKSGQMDKAPVILLWWSEMISNSSFFYLRKSIFNIFFLIKKSMRMKIHKNLREKN